MVGGHDYYYDYQFTKTKEIQMRASWKFLTVIMSVLLAVSLGIVACSSDDPSTDTCEDPTPHECDDGQCHECCIKSDCNESAGEDCVDYECVVVGLSLGADCSLQPESCATGLACDVFSNSCVLACTTDSCADDYSAHPFKADLVCTSANVCDFNHCNDNGNCQPGQACLSGNCVTIPGCDQIASCSISPKSAVVQQGTSVELTASAYFASGALVPGAVFGWTSSANDNASVANGVVTGGSVNGEAVITATVEGCEVSCDAKVTNYAAVESGARVLVVDEILGTPIEGISVEIAGEIQTTGADGAAVFADYNAPADINVFHREYGYITMRQVQTNDVIVGLGKTYHVEYTEEGHSFVAGGVKGQFDFDMIRCHENYTSCDVRFAFAGLSIPNIINLNLDTLIGGVIKTDLDLGVGNPMSVNLPAGLVICLQDQCFKPNFSPTGTPGNRAAWGLGGKIDSNILLNNLGPLLTGGDTSNVDVSSLVGGLAPIFSTFSTALVPNVNIENMPMVVDTDDINGNLQTADFVPNYGAFAEKDLPLDVPMDVPMTFTVPNGALGTGFDAVLLLAGIAVPEAGLIPLGLNVGLDSVNADDPNDGNIDAPISLTVADVRGRIPEDQVTRLVIALALDIDSLLYSRGRVITTSAQVIRMPNNEFSGNFTLEPFMAPCKAYYNANTRTLTVLEKPEGATYFHSIYDSPDNSNWHVLGGADDWQIGDYTLPPDTNLPEDRSVSANLIGVKLDGVSYQDYVAFNGSNMNDLTSLVTAFSYTDAPECWEDAHCSEGLTCCSYKCAAEPQCCSNSDCQEGQKCDGNFNCVAK
jgi:hypothetical protein